MMTIEQKNETCGLVAELTLSQTVNFSIIRRHWRILNEAVKKYGLSQGHSTWVKYGITFKAGEHYRYLAAIPIKNFLAPDHFMKLDIPAGDYEVFTHRGAMENLKNTVYEIYKTILPKSNLNVEDHTRVGFIHFEQYDSRFKWNNPDSEIDIYLPVKTNGRIKNG
jgi:predicted transcriptional regulator YdeE